MINPISYETAQGMVSTENTFTNRPYFISNRRLNRAAEELASEYTPINYGKIQTLDSFTGEVGKFRRPDNTGISDSDILSWYKQGLQNELDASDDWVKAVETQRRLANEEPTLNELAFTPDKIYTPNEKQSINYLLNKNSVIRGGEYIFKGGKQVNSDDVGRGSGRHIDFHLAGSLKGKNPINYTDRFMTTDGTTLKSLLDSGKVVPSAGQAFGTTRKGYKHGGIDFDKRVPEIVPNPAYEIKRVIPKHDPNGYGHYVQIEYTDGVKVGLGHMGKENVKAFMESFGKR